MTTHLLPDGSAVTLVAVAGGRFRMGSVDFYPEEAPVHDAEVGDLLVATTPVTVAQFRAFVEATGHVTTAERPADPDLYPGASPEDLVAGSLVFTPPDHPVRLDDVRAWWSLVPGAQWRHPDGPGSVAHDDHPVTHVSHDDATAYAAWAGLVLPTEAEWEHLARGGLDGATYAWGEDTDRHLRANTWHGEFPHENRLTDGFARTSPVGSFPPNGYGLLDVTGNVWEWTDSPWTPDHGAAARLVRSGEAYGPPSTGRGEEGHACCGPDTGARQEALVIKGGSHLCAPSYCLRYRPAARQHQPSDGSTSHLGFRCLLRP